MGQIDVMAAQIGKGSEDAVIPILIILCKLVLLFLSLSLSIVSHLVIVASRSWGWEIFREYTPLSVKICFLLWKFQLKIFMIFKI